MLHCKKLDFLKYWWFRIVPNDSDSEWFQMITKWFQMIPNDSEWFWLIPNDFEWFWMIPNDSEWFRNDSEWFRMIPKWFRNDSEMIPNDSEWFRIVLTDSEWFFQHLRPGHLTMFSIPDLRVVERCGYFFCQKQFFFNKARFGTLMFV